MAIAIPKKVAHYVIMDCIVVPSMVIFANILKMDLVLNSCNMRVTRIASNTRSVIDQNRSK